MDQAFPESYPVLALNWPYRKVKILQLGGMNLGIKMCYGAGTICLGFIYLLIYLFTHHNKEASEL